MGVVNILLIYSFDCIDPGQNHNDHCWDFTSIMHSIFELYVALPYCC